MACLIPSPHLPPPARGGFSLVEMAIVVALVGLVLLTIYPALTAFREGTQQNATRQSLDTVLRAAAAYVQARGCLPCPTPDGTSGAGLGVVRGDSSASPPACGTCTTAEGIVPFVSLGIPQAVARDGYGRFLTLRVDPALTANFAVTPPTAPCLASDLPPNPVTPSCVTLNASQKGLCQAGLATANRISITTPGGGTQQAALLVMSHGRNGYGALAGGQRLVFPATIPACSGTGGFERCNGDGTLAFVASEARGGTDPFDDLLLFLDRNALVSLLGGASCQTVW